MKNRKHTKEQKYVRGETRYNDDSDDVILTPHHSPHRKNSNKYTSNRTKPKKFKKGVNYKTNWDEDDVILNSFEEKQNSRNRHHDHLKQKFKNHHQRFAKHHSHHHHHHMKSDDTILKPNFNMDSFFDDFDRH